MTRHEIQVLRAAGIPERAVAQRTAVCVRSVERISKQPSVTGPIRTVRIGRPSATAAWGRSPRGVVGQRPPPAGRGERVTAAPAIDLDALLRRVHLPTVRRLYSDLATRAESEDMAYRDYLAILMAEESRIARRLASSAASAGRTFRFSRRSTSTTRGALL